MARDTAKNCFSAAAINSCGEVIAAAWAAKSDAELECEMVGCLPEWSVGGGVDGTELDGFEEKDDVSWSPSCWNSSWDCGMSPT